MDIQHALLGLLSEGPLSGYDMKRILQRTPLFHWSGNNNQVYRALADLEREGLIATETLRADDAPTKKLHRLTAAGSVELRRLALSFPEVPEIRSPFLVQLLFSGGLSRVELAAQLDHYATELEGAERAAEGGDLGWGAGPFASSVAGLALAHLRETYAAERRWIGTVRDAALPLLPEAAPGMPVEAPARAALRFAAVRCGATACVVVAEGRVRSAEDGLALVSACAEHDANAVLLPSAAISEEFLRLQTRVAGAVLQKLANYRIRAAAVLPPERIRGAFADFAAEADRGGAFRIFGSEAEAAAWLGEGETA